MAALNTLREKFARDRSAARRDDGLKTFEWKGPDIPCAKCATMDRNLNSAGECTECATGIKSEPVKPVGGSMTASEYKDKLAGKLDTTKWPYHLAPRPAEALERETFLRKPFTLAGTGTAPRTTHKLDEADLLHFQDGVSNKFYVLSRYDHMVELRWGRASAEGQRDTKVFHNASEALAFYRKQLKSKVDKGYKVVWSGP